MILIGISVHLPNLNLSNHKDTAQHLNYFIYVVIVVYLITTLIVWKREDEQEYGVMSNEDFFLLIEVLLKKHDLLFYFYNHIFNEFFIFTIVFWYLYKFLFRFSYKINEIDDVCELLIFGISGISLALLCHFSAWPIIIWSLFTVTVRLCLIWYQQKVVATKTNLLARAVSIQCSEPAFRDFGHVYLVVGEDFICEITLQEENDRIQPIIEKNINRSNVEVAYYFIPLIQYGYIGFTYLDNEEIRKLFVAKIEDNYNLGYHNCQELALNMARQICVCPFNINVLMLKPFTYFTVRIFIYLFVKILLDKFLKKGVNKS